MIRSLRDDTSSMQIVGCLIIVTGDIDSLVVSGRLRHLVHRSSGAVYGITRESM